MAGKIEGKMKDEMKVAVIGAGPAGLCALRHLLSSSPSTIPVAFERNSRIGGLWLHTEDTSKLPLHSAVYDSMRTNLPKEIMPYEGFPFPSDLPTFMHHSDFLKYLESFKNHFNLEQYIRFNNEVTKVNPKPHPQDGESSFIDNVHWEVTSRDVVTREERKEQFDAIIVCNGHYSVPYTNLTGLSNFKGRVLHSQKYRNPGPFKSEVVLIVGGATSGIDIAAEVSSVAKQVFLSCRRIQVGVRSQLPDSLEFVPGTSSIMDNGSVLLDNGRVLDGVDTIILSIGYKYDCPFLSEECGVIVSHYRIQPLYKHVFNIPHPSMVFIGLNYRGLGPFNFDAQMNFVTAVFSGRVTLPGKAAMLEDEEREYQDKLSNGLLPQDAHSFIGGRQWRYLEDIERICSDFSFPKIWEDIFKGTDEIRDQDVANYKNYKLIITDEENKLFQYVSPSN